MTSRVPTIAFTLLVSLAAGCVSSPSRPAIDGRWQPVSAELDGVPLPIESFRGAVMVLSDGSYTFGLDRGRYVLVAGGPPFAMDIDGREGPNAGRSIAAIYRLDDGALVVCYQLGDGPRPTEFRSTAASRTFLVRYRAVGDRS